VNCAIFRVIKDFWVGLQRQTQTLGAFVAANQNFSSRLGLVSMRSKVYPSIISSASCFLELRQELFGLKLVLLVTHEEQILSAVFESCRDCNACGCLNLVTSQHPNLNACIP
jgi:hypothetical protein